MGSWGSKIFESDTASESISRVVTALTRELEDDLNSLNDGILERPGPACVAMLNALAGTSAIDVSLAVSAEEARNWRAIMNEWFVQVQQSEARDAEHWKGLAEAVDKEFGELVERLVAVD